MMNKFTLLAFVCLAMCVPSAFGFWRLNCYKPITVQRIDPIVAPGRASAHMHTVMGASGFHANSTPDSIRQSKCSTCTVKEDNSNYWIPNLFYQWEDGTLEAVPQIGGMIAYYLQRGDGKLNAFPAGLRMIAGDPHRTSYVNTPEASAINYMCVDYSQPFPETHAFPQRNCPQGLRVQVYFPSCWNGRDLDSPDHKSHMAYPSGIIHGGKCPSSHPVQLINLFYEIYYDASKFKTNWIDDSGKPKRAMPFIWSSGDNTGFGHHGDFMNGWNTEILQKAVEQCTDMSGVIEKCPFFTHRSVQECEACKPDFMTQVEENISGRLQTMPNIGKIPVSSFDPCGHSPFAQFDDTKPNQPLGTCRGGYTGRPAYTPTRGNMLHDDTHGPAAKPAVKKPEPIDQRGYLGCWLDHQGGRRSFERLVEGGFEYTPETCRAAVKRMGAQYTTFGLTYGGECWASVNSELYRSQGPSNNCNWECKADKTKLSICGGPAVMQAYRVNF